MGRTLSLKVQSLQGRGAPLASPEAQRARLGEVPLAQEFEARLAGHGLHPLKARGIHVLQVNVGKLCNQTCRHCHVDAGPDRTEVMSRDTMALCLRALELGSIPTLDITGGAPELNPELPWLIRQARPKAHRILLRCNLTVLLTGSLRELPQFLASHGVEVVASLPHYRSLGTDRQRGEGVFARSIEALKMLNAAGYAMPGTGLRLTLVTNPVGAFLPASQASLEREWKRELERQHGVRFDQLLCLTNMPISRFLEWLEESGNLDAYVERLEARFNPAAAQGVMCRDMLSVAWDGRLYDCDFNQMLELPIEAEGVSHIGDYVHAQLSRRSVVVGRHCYGCTAGAGSSCGGETA